MRDESDSMLSNAWLLVYLIPIVAILLAMAFFFLAILGILVMGIVGILVVALAFPIMFLVSLVLTYKLIKRRNTHFKRQQFLLEDIAKAAKAIAEKKGVDAETGLSSLERTAREAKAEETEKGAVLWAILSAIIPVIAEWYIMYFLMKDFYRHERREDGFWEDLGKVLDKLGVKFSAPRRSEILPDRSFVLYLILSIITLGLFRIYWLYVLLKDPNTHFQYHIQAEDQLLSTLESAKL
jgi:hypothetical protein